MRMRWVSCLQSSICECQKGKREISARDFMMESYSFEGSAKAGSGSSSCERTSAFLAGLTPFIYHNLGYVTWMAPKSPFSQ